MHEDTKMRILNIRYQTNTVHMFEVVGVPQLCGTLVLTFLVDYARLSMENKRSYKERNFSVPD